MVFRLKKPPDDIAPEGLGASSSFTWLAWEGGHELRQNLGEAFYLRKELGEDIPSLFPDFPPVHREE